MGIKKLALNLVLGAALVIAPLSASALTPMSDNNMKDVTGQAGVSIGLDDVVIYQSIGETRYTDTDGWGAASEGPSDGIAGSVVISDKNVLKQFNAILTDTRYGMNQYINGTDGETFGDYGAGIAPSDVTAIANPADGTTFGQLGGVNNTSGISPLTIDIGTCTALTAGYNYNHGTAGTVDSGTIAGVIIGLPTIEIVTSADSYSVGIAQASAVNDGDNFIQISKSNSTMAILGGRIEIAAH